MDKSTVAARKKSLDHGSLEISVEELDPNNSNSMPEVKSDVMLSHNTASLPDLFSTHFCLLCRLTCSTAKVPTKLTNCSSSLTCKRLISKRDHGRSHDD